MSLFNVFNIAGSALSAENIRLNTTASNLANAQSVSGSAAEAYRARQPVFSAVMLQQSDAKPSLSMPAVQVSAIVEDQSPAIRKYSPGHPMADKDGYVYMPDINPIEEMANMISASRSYQNNVQVMDSAKQMMLMTLRLGQS